MKTQNKLVIVKDGKSISYHNRDCKANAINKLAGISVGLYIRKEDFIPNQKIFLYIICSVKKGTLYYKRNSNGYESDYQYDTPMEVIGLIDVSA